MSQRTSSDRQKNQKNRFRPGVEAVEGRLLQSVFSLGGARVGLGARSSQFGRSMSMGSMGRTSMVRSTSFGRSSGFGGGFGGGFGSSFGSFGARRSMPQSFSFASFAVAPSAPVATAPAAPAPVAAPTPAPQVATSAMNQQVLNFARGTLGQKVGDGQCSSLADAALASAGSRARIGGGLDADYNWGQLVATLNTSSRSAAAIQPGDIIQFRDVEFYFSDGNSWRSSSYTHHTAIVAGVSGDAVTVLHQNVGPASSPDSVKQIVQEGSFNVSELTGGTMWVYRPTSA